MPAALPPATAATASDEVRRAEAADVRRREFVLGGVSLAALALSGCGEDEAAAPAPATRAFKGPWGSVDVPQRPRRVVTMYPTDTDIALVLGLPLAAAPGATGSAAQPFAAYQAPRLRGVRRITTYAEPNFEQIAAQRPDVIIDSALSSGERTVYDRLSRIAPTVAMEPKDWREYLTAMGRAFGRERRVQGSMERYDARAADIRAALGDRWAGKTFASVFAFAAEVIVADATAQVHHVLERDLGMRLHRLAVRTGERVTLPAENLGRLDADVLLVPVYPQEKSLARERRDYDALRAQPLWERLAAVRAGQVFEFDGELVYTSPLTAAALLERLGEVLSQEARDARDHGA